MIVKNGAGVAVKQKGTWAQFELMSSIDADVIRDNNDDSSVWNPEWGDMPGGAASAMPPWRAGGPPEVVLAASVPRRPGTAGTPRRRPVAVTMTTSARPDSVGVAGVEARLRQWLDAHRVVHEPRRMTLIRMLGAGLTMGTGSINTDKAMKAKAKEEADKAEGMTPRGSKRFNGLPLDADGRPVGIRASFPNALYAAVDRLGNPLPVEERKSFYAKPMPVSKRFYHPLAAPPAGSAT